jgi:DNA-binding LytR/AlgR family response regulator
MMLTDGVMVLDKRPLVQWTGLPPPAEFLRIHCAAIVNLQHIRDIE